MLEKKIIECNNCSKKIRIPLGKNIRFSCPSCQKKIKFNGKEQLSKDYSNQKKFNESFNKSFVNSTATNIENTQWTKYRTKTGHGFSAEDANALNDILKGYDVEKVGLSNKKNGADRILNGQAIQTKYHRSAYRTVESAFDLSGNYRYKNQKLEVPNDQYNESVRRMAQKIKEGKVNGVTDSNQAKNIIKKGNVTYAQAKNIAKAGTIDSIKFDIKNQAITTSYAFGISFAVNFMTLKTNGVSNKEATFESVNSALKSSGLVLTSGILTQQFLRTSLGRNLSSVTSQFSKQAINSIYKSEIGKKVIHRAASNQVGKQIAGGAAKNTAIKVLRTNAITGIVTTAIFTAPDLYRAAFTNTISWSQFSKNLAVNTSGVAGGIGAGILGGVWAGPPGAIIGGIIGGIASSWSVKKVADLISEDDSKKMYDLISDEISNLAFEHMLTKNEFELIKFETIFKDKIDSKWLRELYIVGIEENENSRKLKIHTVFESEFTRITYMRPTIILPTIDVVLQSI